MPMTRKVVLRMRVRLKCHSLLFFASAFLLHAEVLLAQDMRAGRQSIKCKHYALVSETERNLKHISWDHEGNS